MMMSASVCEVKLQLVRTDHDRVCITVLHTLVTTLSHSSPESPAPMSLAARMWRSREIPALVCRSRQICQFLLRCFATSWVGSSQRQEHIKVSESNINCHHKEECEEKRDIQTRRNSIPKQN